LQHDILSHTQTASDKEAEAAYVSEAALVTAVPSSTAVADKPELLVDRRPAKAGCILFIKKGRGFRREQEFLDKSERSRIIAKECSSIAEKESEEVYA
jgi:hypothetical protein